MPNSNTRRGLTDEQKMQIVPLINDQGMTQMDISKKFGCHVQTIRYWVRKIRKEAVRSGVDIKINTRAGRRPTRIPHG